MTTHFVFTSQSAIRLDNFHPAMCAWSNLQERFSPYHPQSFNNGQMSSNSSDGSKWISPYRMSNINASVEEDEQRCDGDREDEEMHP